MEEQNQTSADAERGRDGAAVAKLVAASVLLLLFIVFALQNAASINVEFLVWEFQMRRIILIVLSATIGITVWEFARLLLRRRKGEDN